MHISTTALYVILLHFLGLQAAYAAPYEDAFGHTKYGFQCEGRVYTKPVIYAAAKHLCDEIPKQDFIRLPSYSSNGYRRADDYKWEFNHEASHLLNPSYYFSPIFEDGRLFPLGPFLSKDRKPKMNKIDPGPDRLVIDEDCNVKGAFSDLDYRLSTLKARVVACSVLNSKEDYRRPSIGSSGSPGQSPEISNVS